MNSKILAVAAVITALVGGSVNSSVHAEEGFNLSRVPSIELNCTGLGSVVFWTTGELEGDNVQADYVDRVGNTIFFTNGVKLSGVLAGDALLFDTSTMKVHGKEYTCSGE